ncbi:MAG: S-layer homology domain-containing protein [Bacillota bacterium]|nr:S-layer homology domain-containing protein [Gammaproteobacteria bacterium]
MFGLRRTILFSYIVNQSNISGIVAKADFNVHMVGATQNDSDSDGGGDGESPRDDANSKENALVEEPVEVIPDIAGHWAHDCVETLLRHGIIQGYPDGTIKPENFLTRAEAAALLCRVLRPETTNAAALGYQDHLPAWAKDVIMTTSEKRIFRGYPGNVFLANKEITREEMTCVLIRAFDKKLAGNLELSFIDKDQIGIWAVGDLKAGVQNKVIGGYPDHTFKPRQNITRAEAFCIICRLMGLHAFALDGKRIGIKNYYCAY